MNPEIFIGGGFAVAVAGFLVRFLTQLVQNHMEHNTQALNALTAAVTELTHEVRLRNTTTRGN